VHVELVLCAMHVTLCANPAGSVELGDGVADQIRDIMNPDDGVEESWVPVYAELARAVTDEHTVRFDLAGLDILLAEDPGAAAAALELALDVLAIGDGGRAARRVVLEGAGAARIFHAQNAVLETLGLGRGPVLDELQPLTHLQPLHRSIRHDGVTGKHVLGAEDVAVGADGAGRLRRGQGDCESREYEGEGEGGVDKLHSGGCERGS
jgi:hypothetical protein